MTTLRTLKYADLTRNQAQAAKRFSEQHGDMTVSQCAKYLEYIFALKRGEITPTKFREATGHNPAPFVEK